MKILATLLRIPCLDIRRLRRFAPIRLFLTGVFFACAAAASAQDSALGLPRITSKVDDTQLVALKGNTPPMAQKQFDRGALPDSTPANRIQLVLKRSDEQETALKQRIGDMQNPNSELFHKWLTPAEFGRQFGPADSDVAKVTAWLQDRGFTINKVSQGKGTIDFNGTAGTIKSAFHTEMHTYVRNGVTFHSNSGDPRIPAALKPVVAGLVSLNDIKPKSNTVVLGTAKMDMQTHRAIPDWNDGQQCASFTNGQFKVFNCTLYPPAPGDLAVQYNLASVYKAGTTGKGITVGVLSASNVDLGIVQNYRTAFGFTNTTNLPQVIVDGDDPGQNDASTEAYLDVEALAAMAPDATTNLYTSNGSLTTSGLVNAIIRGVDDNEADVLTLSYGECEQEIGPSGNQFFYQAWEQAAAQGQTVFVASGDSGSAGCDNENEEGQAMEGLAVSGFASTPFNTAVGGTDFYYSKWAAGFSDPGLQAQLTAAWGTPTSISPQASLIAPLPEQVWNEGYGSNIVSQAFGHSIAAGGGGASNCVQGSNVDPTTGAYGTCSGGYPKPSWQSGTGVPADGVRDIPDVSFFASNELNLSFWPICAGIYDCRINISTPGYSLQTTGIGGTSAATPAVAGIMALIDQTQKGRQGNANPTLYALAAQFPDSFNDLTIGGNNVPCVQGTPSCSLDTNGDGLYTLQHYSDGVGYDQASGLGTINGANLIANWGKIAFNSTTTTLSLTPTSIVHGASVTATTAVTGTGGTPTGSVALTSTSTIPGQTGLGAVELTNGNGTGTINSLPGGTYTVSGRYGGDSVFAASTSSATALTVTPEASSVSILGGMLNIFVYPNVLSSFAAGASIPYVDTIYLDAAVAGKSGYGTPTGVVTFKDGSTVIGTANVDSGGVAEFVTGTLSPGAHSITASYVGDSSFNASTSTTGLPFTVTQGTPEFFLVEATSYTSAGQTIYAGQPLIVEANVSAGLNPAAAPTGSVTITFGSLTPQTATLVPGNTSGPYGAGFVTFTPTVPGTYVLSGTYSGDVNYQAAVDPYPATITVVAPTLAPTTTTFTTSGTSFGPDGVITLTTTVTGSVANTVPTGAVNFVVGAGIYQVQLDSTGKATAGIGAEALSGPTPVYAQYQGDTVYAQSSSAPIIMSANTGDYTLVASNSNIAVTSGASGSSTLTIAQITGGSLASGGLLGAVNFTCTTSTPSITCAFNPASVNLMTNVQSTTVLTIATKVLATASNQPQHPGLFGKGLAGGGIAIAAIFFLFPVKRRSVARLLLLALAAGISLSMVACGGNGSGSTAPTPPKYNDAAPGTYQVLVNTNLSGVQHSLVLNVIVQ